MARPCWRYEAVQVVNIWPFHIPVLGPIAKIAGYPNIRKMQFAKFSRATCDLIRQGVSIVSFPEGTRSRDRAVMPFHGAIFRVALETRCPIVPLCISGNEAILPPGRLLLHPGTIKIHKLPALEWEEYRLLTPFKLKNKVRDIISQALSEEEVSGE